MLKYLYQNDVPQFAKLKLKSIFLTNSIVMVILQNLEKMDLITGKMVEDTSMEAKKQMLDRHSSFLKQYQLDDGVLSLFYLDDRIFLMYLVEEKRNFKIRY